MLLEAANSWGSGIPHDPFHWLPMKRSTLFGHPLLLLSLQTQHLNTSISFVGNRTRLWNQSCYITLLDGRVLPATELLPLEVFFFCFAFLLFVAFLPCSLCPLFFPPCCTLLCFSVLYMTAG